MKLSKQEIIKIAKIYNLGRVTSFSQIKGGAINYNYTLKTEKGDFVVRILGRRLDGWKKEKLNLEFRTLKFLKQNDFPYEIPEPALNKNHNYLTTISGKNIWIYKKLEGKVSKKINLAQMREIAKAIAIYHKFVSKIKIKKKKLDDSWAIGALENAKQANSNNKEIEFILNCLKKVKCYKFGENMLVTHSDFNRSNLLFRNNKLAGILDFDNLEAAPRVKDIAYAIRRFCYVKGNYNASREKTFIKEYEKISKISKKEKSMIIDFMIRDCGIFFWWALCEMKKTPHKRHSYLNEAVDMAKKLTK